MNRALLKKYYDKSLVQRTADQGDMVTYFDYVKFSELLLKEYAQRVEKKYWEVGGDIYYAIQETNQDFGVKDV